MTIQEMKAKRSDLYRKMDRILQDCEASNRNLTIEEKREWDEMEKEYSDLDERILAHDSQEQRRKDLQRARSFPEDMTLPGQAVKRVLPGTPGARYDELFRDARLDMGGWGSFQEFLTAVAEGRPDERLYKDSKIEKRVGTTFQGTFAGFAVPGQVSKEIYDSVLETAVLFPRVRVYPITEGKELTIPCWDNESHASGSYGGFVPAWTMEGTTNTEQDPALRTVDLELKNFYLFSTVTQELLADSIGVFESSFRNALVKSCSFELDGAILDGSGVGKPKGILQSNSILSLTRNTAANIDYDDLVRMYTRLYPGFRRNAAWIVHPEALAEILTLTDTAGNYIWSPSSTGATGRVQMYLLGLPIIETEHAKALGTTGDILLADLSQYAMIFKDRFLVEASPHARFRERKVVFGCFTRCDGTALIDERITPRNGSEMSWAVVLE